MPLGFVRAGFRDDPINGVATVLVGGCLRALRVECQLYTLLARKRPFRIRPKRAHCRHSDASVPSSIADVLLGDPNENPA